jgi:hypothetical protein
MPYTVLGEGITALFSLARGELLRPVNSLYTEMGQVANICLRRE